MRLNHVQHNMDFASKDEYELSSFDPKYTVASTLMASILNCTELQYMLFHFSAQEKQHVQHLHLDGILTP